MMRVRHRCDPERGSDWRSVEHDVHDVGWCGVTGVEGRAFVVLETKVDDPCEVGSRASGETRGNLKGIEE